VTTANNNISGHFYDEPFPTINFVSSSHVNEWLRALDKRGLAFHFDDDPYHIVNREGERTFTDEQAACITRCVKRFNELIGDDCLFQYASDHVGGDWSLPVHEEEGGAA
jgi:hypothetical protein